jgi:PAS domain S-box-containing protein
MAQGVFYQQADGKLIDVNNAALEMFGLTREQFLGQTSDTPDWQVLCDDDSVMPGHECPSMMALRSGNPVKNVRAGVFNPYKNGYIWVSINAIPQFMPGETKPFQVFVTLHDFTKRKHIEEQLKSSLQEKEVLLRELHHRTKNNMYVISAMLALQAGSIKDQQTQKIFRDVQNRIQAMALTHQKLYQSKNLSSIDLAEYIRDLSRWLMQSYKVGANQITLNFDLEPTAILIDTAVPCGLVINELMANALEHAFPDHRPGEITIKLNRNDGKEITLEVKDSGVGLPVDFDISSPSTFGLQMVKNIIEHQLQGRFTIKPANGVNWQINFFDNLYDERV